MKKSMNTTVFNERQNLQEAFSKIAKSDKKDYICEIAELIAENNLNKKTIQDILTKFSIGKVKDIKNELLDILIDYTYFLLEDNALTDTEKRNFDFLKLYFEIKEGDFYTYKLPEIKLILDKQLDELYSDNLVTREERIHKVDLQDLFDLSYDQLDEIKEGIVKKTIARGGNFIDLDTANTKFWTKK